MPHSTDDYYRLIDNFKRDVSQLGQELISIILYGSVARGTIRPGVSDLIDAYVVFDESIFAGAERYERALLVLVDSCRWLARCNIPFHPAHYYTDKELETVQPAVFLPTLKQSGFSTIIFGPDIRPGIDSSFNSRQCAKAEFYSFYRYLVSLGHLAMSHHWSERERMLVVAAVTKSYKKLPLLACLAMDTWVEQSEGRRELERKYPDLDLSILDESHRLDIEHLEDNILRPLFCRILDFVEELNTAVKTSFCKAESAMR
jgi:hypothetical protein